MRGYVDVLPSGLPLLGRGVVMRRASGIRYDARRQPTSDLLADDDGRPEEFIGDCNHQRGRRVIGPGLFFITSDETSYRINCSWVATLWTLIHRTLR